MRGTGIWLSAAVLAVAGLTAACTEGSAEPEADQSPSNASTTSESPGQSPTPDGSTSASSSTPTSSEPEVDPAARKALRKAQLKVVEADTGTAVSRVGLPGVIIEATAYYEISSRSMELVSSSDSDAEGRLVTHAIAIGDEAWFRIEQGPDGTGQRCWMTTSPAQIQQMTGVDMSPPGSTRGLPGSLTVALNSKALSRFPNGSYDAEVDLFSLAGAVTGKFPIALGIEFDSPAQGALSLEIEDGAVRGWRAYIADIVQAAIAAGVDVPDEGLALADVPRNARGYMAATLGNFGDPVRIEAPPPDRVIEISVDDEQFQADREACESRQAG